MPIKIIVFFAAIIAIWIFSFIFLMFRQFTYAASTYQYKLDSFFVGLIGIFYTNTLYSGILETWMSIFSVPAEYYENIPIYQTAQQMKATYGSSPNLLYFLFFCVSVILLVIACLIESRIFDKSNKKNRNGYPVTALTPTGEHSVFRGVTKYIYTIFILYSLFYLVDYIYLYPVEKYEADQAGVSGATFINMFLPKYGLKSGQTDIIFLIKWVFTAALIFSFVLHLVRYISQDIKSFDGEDYVIMGWS